MSTRNFLHLLFTVCCLIAIPCLAKDAQAVASVATIQDGWSVPGILGGGVKASDAYVDGSIFLTVPAYSSIGQEGRLAGDVIFVEPYTSWGEQGEVAVSLGVGWRHLFSDQSVSAVTQHDGHQAGFFEEGGFVGASLFFDMLDTQFDNRFWQLGFGLEAGTRYVEMRANYYVPLTDRKLAEEIRTRESFTTHSTVTDYAEPFATGHTIQQDVTLSTLATTTTIERLFRRYEEGMEGWDAEVALLVPWIDRWMDVKVIVGYYAFDNQPFGPQVGGTGDVDGWKIGAEVRPVPAVVLNATWYEDDRLTGSDWTAGVRLEIPFEAGDLGDGKGLWDRVADAFRPRRRHLVERMAEPVRRQNAAIKTSNSVEEDKSAAEVKVVTKVVSRTKNRIVLADTVVFVDNAIGSATNPGTYEAPLDTITNGMGSGNTMFGPNAIVLVQGRPESYKETVFISQGVRLFGSGSFPAEGGQVFHGRTDLRPLISGGFYGSNIPGTVQISGFDIRDGIAGTPASVMKVESVGAGIFLENVAKVIITGNSIVPQPLVIGGIYVETTQGHSDQLIAGNVLFGGHTGAYLLSAGSAVVEATIAGNAFLGGHSQAFAITLTDNAVGHFDVRDNTAIGSNGHGFYFDTSKNATGVFTVTGNTVAGNGMYGMNLIAYDTSQAWFMVTANSVVGNRNGGIFAMAGDPGSFNQTFLGDNDVSFNRGDQIFVRGLGTLILQGSTSESNTVREATGNAGSLYNAIEGTEHGAVFLNGLVHPANVDLP